MDKILIVSDAWFPLTNGVVTTLAQTAQRLERFGHEVQVIHPGKFRTVPCPSYPEIRVAVFPAREMARCIEAARPRALHIATEGPLGWAARRHCLTRGLRFTTSYHTQFPQYLRSRAPVPLWVSYAAIRLFHAPAQHCMVSTSSVHRELAARGFRNLVRWSRGVDTQLFRPRPKDFLKLPGPVAAYPVTGPIDVVQDGVTGALDNNLARAAERALRIDPNVCRERALRSGWDACTREFESHLVECMPAAAALRGRKAALVSRSGQAIP